MRVAPLLEEDDFRILALVRPLPTTRKTPKLECRQVVAFEESDKVRRADDDGPAHELHEATLPVECVRLPDTEPDTNLLRFRREGETLTTRDRDGSNPWWPPSCESLIDRQILEAQARGAFDDLPFRGERIPLVDDSAAGDWAVAYRMLKGANFAPPWIETDKEVRDLLARRDAILGRAAGSLPIDRVRDERDLREVVSAANDAIFRLNHEAPTERQHRRPLDLEIEHVALARAHATEV